MYHLHPSACLGQPAAHRSNHRQNKAQADSKGKNINNHGVTLILAKTTCPRHMQRRA